jgi:hypothetical protein
MIFNNHSFFVTPVAILRLDFATSFLYVYYFYRANKLLVGLGPYLLLDFSAGLIPLNN